ncbi:MerR family transcriptional regulator [Promicromonospora iranensis]|uniref:DNA-binding transcriptional MerR regulator n=1 Tax=Promicromonospora iranensis TaxID=1105144 RepID=A0ABU2CRC6_9MICO|nr:MerR family transcriptional regulator [Promicromonospora iranensis]MDR7383883.1 DNA-binding transcriptional MerR regulator [Promicromonospora iranensis]
MNTTDENLYPIGDVAHRTGLSVSAIRFYADEGIVAPTDVTASGHRLYGLQAIAELDFIRTLRELGTGLEQIRQVLTGESTLRQLLADHLDVVERQERDLRLRRSVLRALVGQEDPAERIDLMTQLVTMPDGERERLIADFWREVSAGLPAGVADRMRRVRPRLPGDPTAAQLEAWITLAELLEDAEFRSACRSYLVETYATGPGAVVSGPQVQSFIASAGEDVMPKLIAAHASGLVPDDPHVRELAARFVQQCAEALGVRPDDGLWERIASGFPHVGRVLHEALHHPDYEATHGRYLSLVATINGEAAPDAELEAASSPDAGPAGEAILDNLGPWLSEAVLAAKPERSRAG